jgi:hypothetical protein
MGNDHYKQHNTDDLKDHDHNPSEDTVSYHGVETRRNCEPGIDL